MHVHATWPSTDDHGESTAATGEEHRAELEKLTRAGGLDVIAEKARFRFPRQPEQPDLLPDPATFDIDSSVSRLTVSTETSRPPSRRSMEDQVVLLRELFRDRSELMYWHALAISYLRRQTDHTDKARALFFRIWDEKGEWMAENLNGRWLVSALQTFADHGRFPEEKECGSIGFMYGNLVKVYETEIASAYTRRATVERFKKGDIKGLYEFQPGDDILFNINTFVFASTSNAGPAGLALARLMALVRDGGTIFSRTDAIVQERGQGYLSFLGKDEQPK